MHHHVLDGNTRHALRYAPQELYDRFRERAHTHGGMGSVPDSSPALFSFSDRCLILSAIDGLCHGSYVLAGEDAPLPALMR